MVRPVPIFCMCMNIRAVRAEKKIFLLGIRLVLFGVCRLTLNKNAHNYQKSHFSSDLLTFKIRQYIGCHSGLIIEY